MHFSISCIYKRYERVISLTTSLFHISNKNLHKLHNATYFNNIFHHESNFNRSQGDKISCLITWQQDSIESTQGEVSKTTNSRTLGRILNLVCSTKTIFKQSSNKPRKPWRAYLSTSNLMHHPLI